MLYLTLVLVIQNKLFKHDEIVQDENFESQLEIRLINCSHEYKDIGQVKVAFSIYLHGIISIISIMNNEPSPTRIRGWWGRYKIRRDPAAGTRYRDQVSIPLFSNSY